MHSEDWSLESDGEGRVTGRVDLPGMEGGLVLKFEARAAMPSQAQVDAVREFVDAWPALRDTLAQSLRAYWYATECLAVRDAPSPDALADVWSAVWLNEMHVPDLAAKGSRLVRVEGECDWAPDQGLEIGVRNAAELLYLGPNEGKALREPAFASPWNYADARVRDAALSGTPVDEEAFADARAAATPVGTAKRPWWKRW